MILDGKVASDNLFENLKHKINSLNGIGLAVVQIGDHPPSNAYIRIKQKKASELGIPFNYIKLAEETPEPDIKKEINRLNDDNSIGGIVLQLPLPKTLSTVDLIDTIMPSKDIDCLTSYNLGRFFSGSSRLMPATPLGVLRLLDYYDINVSGKNVCVIGKSNLVGKPLAVSLMNKDATVSICHTKTRNIEQYSRSSDIVIIAAGDPKFFTARYFSIGQTVVDVGITKTGNNKVYGDVNFEEVSTIVENITPVPGGVGPMTVYGLFENFVTLNY
jgi:methylenetetrahydrofolate dehydrogenase (NADP+) / methenyltetrahydrofolate cyclohydrolase